MKTKLLLAICLIAALVAGTSRAAPAPEPKKEDATLCAKLVDALVNGDYAAFIAEGSPAFRQMPQDQFTAAVNQLAPRLKAGRTVTFLGELRKEGHRVTVWKIEFADGGDDGLATLLVRDGKVDGFWIN